LKYTPVRKTSPVEKNRTENHPGAMPTDDGQVSGNVTSLDEVKKNIRQAQLKWQKYLDKQKEKHKDLKIENLPDGIKQKVKALHREGKDTIDYDFLTRMIRRTFATWGIDPLFLDRSRTGDLTEDSEFLKILLLQEQLLADREGNLE